MGDFNEIPSYDENDIEDFQDYLNYYGFDEFVDGDANNIKDSYDDCADDSDIRELYF